MKRAFTALFIILPLILSAQVRPDDFQEETNPDNTNFEVYSQKDGNPRKATLLNLKEYFTPDVNRTEIVYVPTATGNAQNLMEFVEDPNGAIWYIDSEGDAYKLYDTMTGDLATKADTGDVYRRIVIDQLLAGKVDTGDIDSFINANATTLQSSIDAEWGKDTSTLGYLNVEFPGGMELEDYNIGNPEDNALIFWGGRAMWIDPDNHARLGTDSARIDLENDNTYIMDYRQVKKGIMYYDHLVDGDGNTSGSFAGDYSGLQENSLVPRSYVDGKFGDTLSNYIERTELQDTSESLKTLIGAKLDTGDVRVHVVGSVQEIQTLTASLGDVIYNNDGGGIYEIGTDTVTGYITDNIAVIPVGVNYAVLQPNTEGVVEHEWFPNNMEGLRAAVDYAVESTEATYVKLINGHTYTDSIMLRQGVSLVGDFIGGYNNSFAGNNTYKAGTRVFVDLQDSTKSFIYIDNSYNDGSYAYSSGVQNVNFNVISKCNAVIWVDMGVRNVIENVSIDAILNGVSQYGILNYGIYIQSGSIGVKVVDTKVARSKTGLYVGGSVLNNVIRSSFGSGGVGIRVTGGINITGCWIENNDSTAIIGEGSGTINIYDLYTEQNLDNSTGSDLIFRNTGNVNIEGGTFNTGGGGTRNSIIHFDGPYVSKLSGNYFGGGAIVSRSSYPTHITFESNTVVGSWLNTFVGEWQDSSHISFIGNKETPTILNDAETFRVHLKDTTTSEGVFKFNNRIISNINLDDNFEYQIGGVRALKIYKNGFSTYTSVSAGQNAGSNQGLRQAFFGSAAGSSITGDDNTGVGASALNNSSTGIRNTAVGSGSLAANSSSSNTAMGYRSGESNSGFQNTFIGGEVGMNNGFNRVHLLGYGITADQSNQVKLGTQGATVTQLFSVGNIDWQVDGTPTDGQSFVYNSTTSQMELTDINVTNLDSNQLLFGSNTGIIDQSPNLTYTNDQLRLKQPTTPNTAFRIDYPNGNAAYDLYLGVSHPIFSINDSEGNANIKLRGASSSFIGSENDMTSLGINTLNPTRDLDVAGDLRIRDLITTQATQIIGSDADGVASSLKLGTGLEISNDTIHATSDQFHVVSVDTGTSTDYNTDPAVIFRDWDENAINIIDTDIYSFDNDTLTVNQSGTYKIQAKNMFSGNPAFNDGQIFSMLRVNNVTDPATYGISNVTTPDNEVLSTDLHQIINLSAGDKLWIVTVQRGNAGTVLQNSRASFWHVEKIN